LYAYYNVPLHHQNKQNSKMKVQYHIEYSQFLDRNIEWKQYGDEGQGVLVFPSQDQRFYEWEDNGMIDVLSPFIERGQIHLICCDSIDAETWSLTDGDQHARIALHERWFRYITEELIPSVNQGQKLVVTGCSMGGYHAGNVFFRRPDLFCSLLSLSGLFHADYFFPDFTDSLIWQNSPLHFLTEQQDPSLLLDAYRGKQIILCCGQGNYEEITCPSTLRLGQILAEKNIPAWVDIWGQDVHHEFGWWRKQVAYFFDQLFNAQLQKVA